MGVAAMAEAAKPAEGCIKRGAFALGTSAVFGGLVGAVEAMWTDAPAVKAEKRGPAIRATWQCVARNSILFGLVGGTFATGDCMAASVRGKDDVWNGVYGGLAAGGVFAMKTASPLRGLGAGLTFGAVSALVDLSGQRLQPERLSDLSEMDRFQCERALCWRLLPFVSCIL